MYFYTRTIISWCPEYGWSI